MYQKDRIYRLTVGDYRNGKGIQIENLQLRFEVSKSPDNKRKGNSATIQVYNLSETSLQLVQGKYLSCILEVGYKETGLVQLVSGNVILTRTVKQGTDAITELIIGEGYTDLNHVKFNFTIPPGKTRGECLREVASRIPNTSIGSIVGVNLNSPIVDGYPIAGNPKSMLNEMCEAWRLEWRVSNGKIDISDENGLVSKNKDEAPLISSTSGLIDIPFYTSDEPTKSKDDKTRREGLQFKALLNPDIVPGKLVRVESKNIRGWYRVNDVRYTGDFRGAEWYIECLCSIVLEDDLK